MKKIISYFSAMILITACATGKRINLETGDVYSIKEDKIDKPLVSFSIPAGKWSINTITLKTMNRGWFDIDGRPQKSPFVYSIKFSIDSLKNYPQSYINTVPFLKSHDFLSYVKKGLDAVTPAMQQEMKLTNLGGNVIHMNGYACGNTWENEKIGPLANEGRGIIVFKTFIKCPLVIDGDIFWFYVDIRSNVDPKVFTDLEAYNKNKRPEEPEVVFNQQEFLAGMGEMILGVFSDLQFHGRVSQNYQDLADIEKIEMQIAYQERATSALNKKRIDNNHKFISVNGKSIPETTQGFIYTEIDKHILIGSGNHDVQWLNGRSVKGPNYANAEFQLLNQIKEKKLNVKGKEITFYADMQLCYKKGFCNDIDQLVRELEIKKLVVIGLIVGGSKTYPTKR